MARKTLEDCPPEALADQVVVVRVDYNLPLDKDGEVVDDTRLVRTLPTIRYLVEAGAKAVLLSHLGRPGGRPDQALSLRPVAGKLEELLGSPVGFCPATTGPIAREAVQGMKSGEVLLLENTRFCPRTAEMTRSGRRRSVMGRSSSSMTPLEPRTAPMHLRRASPTPYAEAAETRWPGFCWNGSSDSSVM